MRAEALGAGRSEVTMDREPVSAWEENPIDRVPPIERKDSTWVALWAIDA